MTHVYVQGWFVHEGYDGFYERSRYLVACSSILPTSYLTRTVTIMVSRLRMGDIMRLACSACVIGTEFVQILIGHLDRKSVV